MFVLENFVFAYRINLSWKIVFVGKTHSRNNLIGKPTIILLIIKTVWPANCNHGELLDFHGKETTRESYYYGQANVTKTYFIKKKNRQNESNVRIKRNAFAWKKVC